MKKLLIPQVIQGSATELPYPDNYFDAVFTDPPYYDNVPYSYLSDFFYVWLKRSIGDLYPELFMTPLTPKSKEIVAYSHQEGGFSAGKKYFEDMLKKAFQGIYRVLKPNGIATIVYTHKSTSGWETLIYIWIRDHRDVPDTSDLKLIILKKAEPERDFIERHGESPRVYRNTIIFLCVDENQKQSFHGFIRKVLALRSIEADKSLNLTENQKKEVKEKIKLYEQRAYEELRKYYRSVFIPEKDGFKHIDLGIPQVGESHIDSEVYSRLRSEGEILEKLSPKVIKEKYLSDKSYVEIKKLFEAFLRTPGEIRIVSEDVFRKSIMEGIKQGLFGLGYVKDGGLEVICFHEDVPFNFDDDAVIIKGELCQSKVPFAEDENRPGETKSVGFEGHGPIFIKNGGSTVGDAEKTVSTWKHKPSDKYKKLYLKLRVPRGKMSDLTRVVNKLNESFNNCEVMVEIKAEGGEISDFVYENIREALNQANIVVIEDNAER